MNNKPVVALSIHDPEGIMFRRLESITPDLQRLFSKVFVSITPATQKNQKSEIKRLQSVELFDVTFNDETTFVGDHFRNVYKKAIKVSDPDKLIHLVTQDRLIFALQKYRDDFLKDINKIDSNYSPLLFQRSGNAWSTHPKVYFETERLVTTVGKNLFNVDLDFLWCHIVLKVSKLKEILPRLKSQDIIIFPEIIFALRKELKTKDVDWLAWEDPFIFDKDEVAYKNELDNSMQEFDKRFSYVIPSIKMLFEKYTELNKDEDIN